MLGASYAGAGDLHTQTQSVQIQISAPQYQPNKEIFGRNVNIDPLDTIKCGEFIF